MNDKDNLVVDGIVDSRPVKEEEIREFKRIMEDEVIPRIALTVEKRRSAAAKSRRKQLKY